MVDCNIYMEEQRRRNYIFKEREYSGFISGMKFIFFKEVLYYHTRDFRFFSGYKHCWQLDYIFIVLISVRGNIVKK